MDAGMGALNEKIVKVVALSALLGLYYDFFKLLLNLQKAAVESVVQNSVSSEDIALTLFINGSYTGMFTALIIGFILLVFKISFMYRFVLFGLLYIVGVIAIPTGMNDEYNYFSLWLRLLITNCVTLFLQTITFTLGMNALFVQNAFNNGTAFTVGMSFFVLTLAVPSLLGQLGASSGTGRAIGSVVRYTKKMR
jgi:hypothetical protein